MNKYLLQAAAQQGSGLNLLAQYKTVYDSFTTKPVSAVRIAQQAFVKALVDGGVWAKLDALWVFAAHTNDAGEALKNWIDPTKFNGTPSATAPTFVAFEGFTGNANNADIDLGLTQSTAGLKYIQNSASAGIFIRKYFFSTSEFYMGDVDNSKNLYIFNSNQIAGQINSATTINNPAWYGPEFVCIKRQNATQQELIFGTAKQTSAGNSVSLDNTNIHVFSNGAYNFGKSQLSFAFIGEFITDADAALLRSSFNTYLESNSKHLKTFSIIGDSISTNASDKWPRKAYGSPWRQKNHAHSGDTLWSQLAGQVIATASDDADEIFIMLGTNDTFAAGAQAATATQIILDAVAALRISNPRANISWINILPRWTDTTGATPVDKSVQRNTIAAACVLAGITCIDTFTDPWITAADTADGLHPNDAGNVKIWDHLKLIITGA